ncbi:MAG TPA: branched-chain amino acid ABC transporter permease [Burkholderiales bacterium]|nr:branched-chain amino acid ABC transporter permease [Burkholderiales bacterium]
MKHTLLALWFALLLTVPLWIDQYFLHVLITTGIMIIAAMSLNLLLGYTGQLSLGHVAFFGIGAYASALTALGFDVHIFGYRIVHEPWPPFAGFAIAILVAALCGYAIGKLSFKVRGAYFVIVTISFAEVTRLVALNWVELTQGPLALNNIPPFTLAFPGVGEYTMWGKVANYYLVLAVGAVAYIVIRRLVLSRTGRAMIALRENEPLATSIGIDVTRYLVLAAVVSAALAGAAGALYAHFVRIIDPDIFLFIYTVTMVIMVITGGKGTLAGPIVGGLIFGMLPVALRAWATPVAQWIIYGVLMILVVFFLPRGIVPAVREWWENVRPRPDETGRTSAVHPSTGPVLSSSKGSGRTGTRNV